MLNLIKVNLILVLLYAIFMNGCLATSGATVGERNKLELMTSLNIKLRIFYKDMKEANKIDYRYIIAKFLKIK